MKTALLLLALLVPSFASANLYKCVVAGTTVYSDTKCSADAKVLVVQRSDVDAEQAVLNGMKTCREHVPAAILKDPESARIGFITVSNINTEEVNGKVQTVRSHYISINSKNALGGYTGSQNYRCFVSLDGKTFIGAR